MGKSFKLEFLRSSPNEDIVTHHCRISTGGTNDIVTYCEAFRVGSHFSLETCCSGS